MDTQQNSWGGKRPNSGRPRTETLDAAECLFLADLLAENPDADAYKTTIDKLKRMAEKLITPS